MQPCQREWPGWCSGAYDPKAGAAATLYNLLVDPRFNHNSEVIGGVREDECGELLSRFFSNHR